MPIGLLNHEWLNQNSQRKYPLADTTSGLDQTGTFKLPDSFIVELDIPVHAGLDVDPGRFFVMHVGAFGNGFSIVVGYQPEDGDAVEAATAQVARQSHEPYSTYALGGINDFDDTVGKVTVGRLDEVDEQPAGYFTFDFENTRLDPDSIRPLLRALTSLTVVNGNDVSAPIYGDVELAAGSGQQISAENDGDVVVVTLSASADASFSDSCLCDGDVRNAPPIRFVNLVGPDNTGTINLLGSTCVVLTSGTNRITISNPCTEPCATCTDLENITRDLKRLFQNATNVETLANNLMTQNEIFANTVLGARLSDRGCSTEG